MAATWTDLADELDRWDAAERVATLWWRDDDAVAPTPALERLLSVAGSTPIALAVIPAAAKPELAVDLSRDRAPTSGTQLAVLQHGWRHSDRSLGGKKSEFAGGRPPQEVAFDVTSGRARLIKLFGSRALPVLVPPWNRFDDRFLPVLGGCGIRGLSRSKPRCVAQPIEDVTEVNVHIDLVAWAGGRGFIGEAAALSGIVGHLRARRLGDASTGEPTGILTHHLVQDEATDAFLRRLLVVTGGHPAARWLDAKEVFAAVALGDA